MPENFSSIPRFNKITVFHAQMYNLLVVLCLLVLPLCAMVLFSARVISKLNMQITPSTNGLTSGLTEIEGRPTVVTSVFSESSFIQARAFKVRQSHE